MSTSLSALEVTVAKLDAVAQIKNAKARYGLGCDSSYDIDAVLATYTRNGVWQGGETYAQGHDQIRAFLAGMGSVYTWTFHNLINPIIDVNDDLTTATGRWQLLMLCHMKSEDSGTGRWVAGRYDDRYELEDGVWKIAHSNYVAELDADHLTGFYPTLIGGAS
jgi:hypothetical protein